jgi:hypothetical protein
MGKAMVDTHPRRERLVTTTRSIVLPAVGALAGVLAVVSIGTMSASFTGRTTAASGPLTAIVVAPPTAVIAQLVVTATTGGVTEECRSDLTWVASSTADVTGYEWRRVLAGTSTPTGPGGTLGTGAVSSADTWTVMPGMHFDWQVRSLRDGWTSTWTTAAPSGDVADCRP